MCPDLDEFGVTVFALSKDTPDEALIHKERDSLNNITLLSDPDLSVIRAYGVEHHKGFGQTATTKLSIGGFPISLAPFKYQAMAIPTTLLIDEKGIIRWIDQSDDYRVRASGERIMQAVHEAFA